MYAKLGMGFTAARLKPRPRIPPLSFPIRHVGIKDGEPFINFFGIEIGWVGKRFEHSLIAKFTVGRPNLAKIQKAFQANRMIS